MKLLVNLVIFSYIILKQCNASYLRNARKAHVPMSPDPKKNDTTVVSYRTGPDVGIGSSLDFIVYLFNPDGTYYSGVVLSEDTLITYQEVPVQFHQVCFNQDCITTFEKKWRNGNYQFWKLKEKRKNPTVYKKKLDDTICYIPAEIGVDHYIDFNILDDGVLHCHSTCMSGDAIICDQMLYGILTAEIDDNLNKYNYVSMAELKRKASFNIYAVQDESNAVSPTKESNSRQVSEKPKQLRGTGRGFDDAGSFKLESCRLLIMLIVKMLIILMYF
ncbi:hypothetical protein QE152_g22684 [Popillia japonica]|uniref:Uncharacterized protein n=1 Tax=Popillia japonica TaxID=7064 RepID=A0AAW1KHW4_POPJA